MKFRTPQLGPETILTLREILPAELAGAEDKLARVTDFITVLDHQQVGLFEYYVVHTHGREKDRAYEIVRFQHFARCSCNDFEFSHTACKHIPICMPNVCRECYETPMKNRRMRCDRCRRNAEHKAQDEAPYLPPPPKHIKPVEKVGGIRIN